MNIPMLVKAGKFLCNTDKGHDIASKLTPETEYKATQTITIQISLTSKNENVVLCSKYC